MELSQTALPIFGWVAITLGIGSHSSVYFSVSCKFLLNMHELKLLINYLFWEVVTVCNASSHRRKQTSTMNKCLNCG